MSTPVRKPAALAGTPRSSGDVQTGEFLLTRGGGRAATVNSGGLAFNAPGAAKIGDQMIFYSGGGRLNTILPLLAQSGSAVTFYDAGTVLASGAVPASGYRVLYTIPGNTALMFPGLINGGPLPIAVDVPFSSGLCATGIIASGMCPFTITYTPESNILDGGAVIGA